MMRFSNHTSRLAPRMMLSLMLFFTFPFALLGGHTVYPEETKSPQIQENGGGKKEAANDYPSNNHDAARQNIDPQAAPGKQTQ